MYIYIKKRLVKNHKLVTITEKDLCKIICNILTFHTSSFDYKKNLETLEHKFQKVILYSKLFF